MSARKSLKRGKVGEGGSAREGSAAWGMMIKRQSSTTYKDRRSGPEPASSDEPGTVSPLISGFGDWLEEHAVLQGYTCYVSVSLSLVVTNPSPEVRCSVGVTPPDRRSQLAVSSLYSLYSLYSFARL